MINPVMHKLQITFKFDECLTMNNFELTKPYFKICYSVKYAKIKR